MSEQKTVLDEGSQSNAVAIAALLIALSSLVGYYALPNEALWIRLSVLIGGFVVAIGMVAITSNGRRFISYSKDSINEVKKVVWPTRKESTQMTLIVFAFVAIMAIFLWSSDKIIEWVIFSLFLGWK
ncbi:MAG: preprotein translocase subunit SecE [Betaproteobacteria bacterium]